MKICLICGEEFQEAREKRFCGRSCSAKWRMRQPGVRAKVYSKEVIERRAKSQRGQKRGPSWNKGIPMRIESRKRLSVSLKRMGHRPSVVGGNGREPTLPQRLLAEKLGSLWKMELAIPLGGRLPGYPTCYKVDLGCPSKKLAIECDGWTHSNPEARAKDAKKGAKLKELGWFVLRLKNSEVLSMCSTLSSRGLRTFLRKAFSSIIQPQ